MDNQDIIDFVYEAIAEKAMEEFKPIAINTFESAGVLTDNKGIVITDQETGMEFQLSLLGSY